MQVGQDLYIYHEKQDAGLCAVHCLNSLLQGRYFSEIDLMEIAKEFDEQERQVMLESGASSNDFLRYMAEDSGNLADDGNYSIQVLSKALEVFGVETIPITNPEMKESKKNPLIEGAFICNLASHWLAIRRLGEDWYNLNSLLSAPEHLSDFYLSAFLDTLMMRGYSIFCVRGNLPKIPVDTLLLKEGNWKKAPRSAKVNAAASGSGDKDLEEALAASELEAAIAASLMPPSPKAQKTEHVVVEDEDDELQAALQLSRELSGTVKKVETLAIQPEPEKGPNVATLVVRLPDGKRLERRFNKEERVEAVYNYLKSMGASLEGKRLVSTFPRREYTNNSQTLEESGLFPGTTLIVE